MLINQFLPYYQFSETHEISINAPKENVMQIINGIDPFDDTISNTFMKLRKLPHNLQAFLHHNPSKPFNFEIFQRLGQNDHELVFGLIGKFWQLDFGIIPLQTPDEYLTYSKTGVAKLALHFYLQETTSNSAILTTETRIFCEDRTSIRKFTPYWYLIRLVSGLIRKRTLKKIKKLAELRQKTY